MAHDVLDKATRKAASKKLAAVPFNTSGIEPTEFNVLLVPDKVEEVSKGGILIPDLTKDRMQAAAVTGTLIAASPLAFTYERWPEGTTPPQPGDRVAYQKFAGMKIKGLDGEEYTLAKDKDIAAVIRS